MKNKNKKWASWLASLVDLFVDMMTGLVCYFHDYKISILLVNRVDFVDKNHN